MLHGPISVSPNIAIIEEQQGASRRCKELQGAASARSCKEGQGVSQTDIRECCYFTLNVAGECLAFMYLAKMS